MMIGFELMQVAIGKRTELTRILSPNEWNEIYFFAEKQAIVGVLFCGIEQLPKCQLPPIELLMEWLGQAERIKNRNEQLNLQCKDVFKMISEDGYFACILKGQGVAQYYDNHLCKFRESGDIDVWIDSSQKDVLKWVLSKNEIKHYDYMHTHLDCFANTSVEVHYRPMISRNILRDCKLQKLACQYGKETFVYKDSLGFAVPNPVYNVVHVFHHIYWHLLVEGVGLRQLMDMFFILQADEVSGRKQEIFAVIKELKLQKFCSALMWVLREVFLLEENFLLCNVNEKEGRFLLKEILLAGNMGHYDERIKGIRKGSKYKLIFEWIKHSMRLIYHYPNDVLWTPLGILNFKIKK